MLKIGLFGLTLSAGSALLLTLLTQVGVAHFGPCGPDAIGLIFFIGFLSTGSIGILITATGLLRMGFRKLQH